MLKFGSTAKDLSLSSKNRSKKSKDEGEQDVSLALPPINHINLDVKGNIFNITNTSTFKKLAGECLARKNIDYHFKFFIFSNSSFQQIDQQKKEPKATKSSSKSQEPQTYIEKQEEAKNEASRGN